MKRLTCLGLALLLCGCASDKSSGPDGRQAAAKDGGSQDPSGGSLWDQLDRAHKTKREKGTPVTQSEAGAKALPQGWKQKIDGWWALYQKNDAGWPAAKAEWLSLAAPAPTILVENLLRAYVFAFEGGQRGEFERAKDELLAIPEHSVPILVIGLSRGAGDTIVRNISEDLLAAAGERAIKPIENAWSGATPKGKTELARTLRKMKSPAATPLLSRIATARDAAFEPRIEAIQGLGEARDAAGYPAVAACLADPDRSVRKFAARNVGAFGRPEAVQLLRQALQQAEARGESDVAEEARSALGALGATP
jgi:HEAT repeats